MEFASTIVERVTNFVLDLSVRHVAYIIRYGRNIDDLNGSVKDLGLQKERVDHQRDEAEKNLKQIEGTVKDWFQKVDEFETRMEGFGNDEGHRKTGLSLSNGLFLYLRNRHRLSRQAKKMTEDVRKLLDESSKFNEVSYQQNVTSNDATMSNVGYVEFCCRKSIIEDIMVQLEDSTVRMIGLHGPGGVGKSTLIKAIANKARDRKLFNVVVIVEITIKPNPQKIQEEIAYVLGLRLEGEGETVRADCLRRRLRKEKENTLLILDDLWDRLDLNKLGIPLDDDDDLSKMSKLIKMTSNDKQDLPSKMSSNDKQDFLSNDNQDFLSKMTSNDKQDLSRKKVKKEKSLGDYKGCKILLTSRKKEVLCDHIKDDESIFCVQALDDKDALALFQKEAGIPIEMSNPKQEIVKTYCAGIPMAIVTVGRALRNKSELVWEATLEKLKKQELVGVHKSMEISVKMSYDHLENEELKSIFLLCAQMGHKPLIMDLVKYCFGLGILEGVYSLRDARERICTSIQMLKDSSLMFDGSSSNHFNMHDMVRDAALSIAYKEQNVFTLRNGKLDDWLELERCTSISICNSDIIDELPSGINCSQLKFFQIDTDDPSLKIPNSFFERKKKLRVLILTGFHLSTLPSSIKGLSNLRMLCLEQCTLDGNLSIIGKLKKLRILSFSGSQIENLPIDLGCLDKLQLLDISNCSIVEMIPRNLISRLTCLEELYIRKSLIKTLVKETNQSQISFLSELKHLHQLKVVDLCIPCATVLPKDLFFDKLNDYKIVIGEFKVLLVGDFRMPNKYEEFRSLALQLKDGTDNIHSQKGIKLLFRKVENLLLGELNGVQNGVDNVIYELNLDGFPDLKHLSITNNTRIKYINSMDLSHPREVFPNLKSLCLYKLKNIEMICCSPVTGASFTKLRTIKVEKCDQLKNLFSSSMVKFLVSLETIDVSTCDCLKEIVEILVISEKVEFLKLQSLTLQSLPLFASFYIEGLSVPQTTEAQITNNDHIEITIAEDTNPPLFGEQVEIPNLESLNLSSIHIHKIWSKEPLSRFCFQNLIKLVVNDCDNLRYLCSLSVANNLKNLKGLFISECPLMEKIFEIEGNTIEKVCIFPKLEEIHISEMKMLTNIWQIEVSVDSFSSLVSVHIEDCEKLDKIFPSHMEGWFESLDNLKVVDCKSVEVIFEINDSYQVDESGGIDTNLQLILINDLPNLKHVWSRDPRGILNFKKLRSIEVSYCNKLRNVLPASVAKDVRKLESISVQSCMGMMEIVAYKDGLEANNEPLEFPELLYVELCWLSNIRHFCKGRYTIVCPKLKKLAVNNCGKLKTFPTETRETISEEENPFFSAEEVIPNLECIQIDFDEAQKWLLSNIVKYHMQHLKELSLRSVKSGELLCRFLHRMPNLEKLQLFNSEHYLLKDSSVPCLGIVLQLKELVLSDSKIKDLGFERDPVLQRLEVLSLKWCQKLIILAPPSVSLTCMTYLEIEYCRGLQNLMAYSTAKSLVQLKTMKVSGCNVKEIVTNEGNEDKIEIVFSKLVTIELAWLPYLTSFCGFKKCEFKFPSLEILIVRGCNMMETFTMGHTKAPKLQNIFAYEGEVEAKWQWEGDLNTTIQKDFQDKLLKSAQSGSYLHLRDSSLQKIWLGSRPIPNLCFSNLDYLVVNGCQFLSEAILPFNLLPFFTKLQTLTVQNCSYVKTIFDVKCIAQDKKITTTRPTPSPLIFPLKRMTLSDLPNLENVWNEDPRRILRMELLEDVNVEKCESLTSVFPVSVTKDLGKLEKLVVKNCEGLMAIVAENNADPRGTFPFVKSLTLWDLPKFKYGGICCIHDAKITFELTPNLQDLTIGENELKMIWRGEFHGNHIYNLKCLTLCFPIKSNVFPNGFLQQVPNIEELGVRNGSFKEIFCIHSPNNVDDIGHSSKLKVLRLWSLRNLVSIWSQNSWIEPFLGNLETLEVRSCFSLLNLVPCTMSFSNLTILKVFNCKGLLYLFTSSTAKSLTQLKRMEIQYCESIQDIVSMEGDKSHEDQIIFQQLNCLKLERLPALTSFYGGSLSFPSLEELSVIYCDKMETLCSGVVKADKLLQVKLNYSDAIPLENDLNFTLQEAFLKKIPEVAQSVSNLTLKDSPLQKIWQRSLPIPDLCFINLGSLIVDGCQFLSDVLPFDLLPFLINLEILEVRNCDSVKTIFDVKCTTHDRKMTITGPTHFLLILPLKKLTLSELPNLENVWNEDPHGTLKMQHLQQVYIDNCKCLTSVFPASVAKDLGKLEDLVMQHCDDLIKIVTEDIPYSRGTNLEPTFYCMTSLTLCDLPKFEYLDCINKLTPNLQHLTLDEKEMKMIWHREFHGNNLFNLKVLTMSFHIGSIVFPCGFLQHVPNMENLVVCFGSFKEIFCLQSPNVDDAGLLSQLKVLILESLPELISIGLENTWVVPVLGNLESLDVSSCSCLTNLAPSPICFSNLMSLFVFECHGLENLFTSSTAKSLARLKIMEIKSCESIKEVVSKEEDESHEDEIIFWQLLYLNIESLPNLINFYKGSLSFPSLVLLSIFECHNMKTLCLGTINADKLLGVKFEKNADVVSLEIDLNYTTRKAFLAM
ncbi:uncharacterized protein LOC109815153 isoform X3 [Cajanus cajan]|nr:uncharacterized protein LOC109815153 isoform X3 [Cajanus cajan]